MLDPQATSDHHFIGPFGVPIKVHWSFVFLIALLTISVASIIDGGVSGISTTGVYLWSFLTTVALLTTLVCHEYGHIFAARHYGIDTNRVLLFLLGGAAEIMEESKTPRQEFMIAAAGPVVSLLFAGLFLGLTVLLPVSFGAVEGGVEFSSGFAAFLILTGVLNIAIVVFNLIPAFPLDGGRLFYATMWKLLGFEKGVKVTYSLSAVMCSSLMLSGLLMMFGVQIPVLGTGIFSGFWLIVIGGLLLCIIGIQYALYVGRDFCPPSETNEDLTSQSRMLPKAAEKWKGDKNGL